MLHMAWLAPRMVWYRLLRWAEYPHWIPSLISLRGHSLQWSAIQWLFKQSSQSSDLKYKYLRNSSGHSGQVFHGSNQWSWSIHGPHELHRYCFGRPGLWHRRLNISLCLLLFISLLKGHHTNHFMLLIIWDLDKVLLIDGYSWRILEVLRAINHEGLCHAYP